MAIFPQVFTFPFATPVYSYVATGGGTTGGSATVVWEPFIVYFNGLMVMTIDTINARVEMSL